MNISVVIPTKNEAENLRTIVPKIQRALGEDLLEIIAANSPSSDNTPEVVAELARKFPKFTLLDCPPGWGVSLRMGYAQAKGDWILSMDCDFLEDENDLKRMVAKAKEGYDMVIGSRYLVDSPMPGYPLSKKVVNRIYHLFIRYMLRIKIKDLTNNFKLFTADIAKNIPLQETHFAASAETGLYPALQGYKIVEVPVKWKQREHGIASFNIRKMAMSYARVFGRALAIRYGFKKIKKI